MRKTLALTVCKMREIPNQNRLNEFRFANQKYRSKYSINSNEWFARRRVQMVEEIRKGHFIDEHFFKMTKGIAILRLCFKSSSVPIWIFLSEKPIKNGKNPYWNHKNVKFPVSCKWSHHWNCFKHIRSVFLRGILCKLNAINHNRSYLYNIIFEMFFLY